MGDGSLGRTRHQANDEAAGFAGFRSAMEWRGIRVQPIGRRMRHAYPLPHLPSSNSYLPLSLNTQHQTLNTSPTFSSPSPIFPLPSSVARYALLICFLTAILLSLTMLGCIRQGTNLWEKSESDKPTASDAKTAQKENTPPVRSSEKLIPAKIPDEPPARPDAAKDSEEQPKTLDRRILADPERVKLEALDMAANLGSIVRMKICHVKEDDEWWAILYKDEGSMIDLKQFVWNRKTEKFEPFLVIRQISRDKLDSDLQKKEPGKTCTPVDVPKKKKDDEKP